MSIQVHEIFTPAGFPKYTYVERSNALYENQLGSVLESPGMIASISGPSKTGKTMLVEKVVGRPRLLEVSGARINSTASLWDRVLDEIDAPASHTAESEHAVTQSAGLNATGGLFAAEWNVQEGRSKRLSVTREREGLTTVLRSIAANPRVLLIDDFHFIERGVQQEICRELKEAAHKGLKICVATVPHRSDDVVRSLPELRGRVMAIDLPVWDANDVVEIAHLGFKKLNVEGNILMPLEFASESAGSPALMQQICLQACLDQRITQSLNRSRTIDITDNDIRGIFTATSRSINMLSQAKVLSKGPKLRGKDRQVFRLADGTSGDVYSCVMKAIISDPPRRVFPYKELVNRVASLISTGKKPTGRSVSGACAQMSNIARDKFPMERFIDWDQGAEILDIVEPYFWFYLRWSDFLRRR